MADYGDILGSFFGGQQDPARKLRETTDKLAEKRKQEQRNATPIPQMRSKTVDGIKYLRAEDVVEALRATDSAVRVRTHIAKWLGQ